jgi:hypothetical protein
MQGTSTTREDITLSRFGTGLAMPGSTGSDPSGTLTVTGDATAFITYERNARRAKGDKTAVAAPPLSPKARLGLRAGWNAARTAAERMARSAENQDLMELAIAADDLEAALAKLWDDRIERDINWKTILNHAQGMLLQRFDSMRVEELAPNQCRSIQQLVDDYLGPSTKSLDDLTEAIRLIEDAGFDPYYAISDRSGGDEEKVSGE